MKKVLLPFLLLAFGKAFCSSPNYSITPSSTLTEDAPYNQLSIYDIFQANTSANKIKLKWTLVSLNVPSGWDYSMCDLGTCYPGIPASGAMDSVAVGGQGFLGLNINPQAIPGTAVVKVFVYENGYFSDGDTLTWIINAVPVSVKENAQLIKLDLFPNPTAENITLSVKGVNDGTLNYKIFNERGQMLAAGKIEEEKMTIITENFSAGIYFCTVYSGDKRKSLVKFLKAN